MVIDTVISDCNADVNYTGYGYLGGSGGSGDVNGMPGMSAYNWTSSFGGASFYGMYSTITLDNCTIMGNSARDDGGAEHYAPYCQAALNGCAFLGNQSSSSGGAQYLDLLCRVDINDCDFIGNYAPYNGGALLIAWDCNVDVNNSTFAGNATYGDGGALYWGVLDGDATAVRLNNSQFIGNLAYSYGGAMYWYGPCAQVEITDCIISDNVAEHGGGMYWSSGAPIIRGCTIKNNVAEGRRVYIGGGMFNTSNGSGGGMFCWSSDALIESCFINGNVATGSGGGVYLGGDIASPILRNCLVRANSAVLDGGGIVSYWFIEPIISNCTIVENTALDPVHPENGLGGGLSCSYNSVTVLIDSILWGNTGQNGNQIAIGSDGDPNYYQYPAELTVSHCDIQGWYDANDPGLINPEAIFVEPGRILNWHNLGDPNILDDDPLFTAGYYLSHTGAGQAANSPCIDTGSDLAANLGLDNFTTRTDGVNDVNFVDMGVHFPSDQRYQLTVNVIDGEHGTVEPNTGLFNKYAVITLTATADAGYRARWTGTNDDSSIALTNTVTMYSDRTVTVTFELPATIEVPGNY
ncbi:MAG: InlB B-repeat-containing protein, partial [Planctomycetota bacterium]